MSTYFTTLEQAKKYIAQKHRLPSKITWHIVDCNIGFLVRVKPAHKDIFRIYLRLPSATNMRDEKNYE